MGKWLLLVALLGQIPTTAPTTFPTTFPTTYPTTAPTTRPTTAPTTYPTTAPGGGGGTAVWTAGVNSYSVRSGSGQCGSPTVNGAVFAFTLVQSGTTCYRNQAMPAAAGLTSWLNPGSTYQWTFIYRDTPFGMGPDQDARALIWQIHPNTCSCTPCTTLNLINGPNGVSSPEYWGVYNCVHGSSNTIVWSGPYTPGASVVWKILATISNPQGTANGAETVWKDGVQVYSASNIVTMCCATTTSPFAQWWNFGPYKWRWEIAGGGGSTLVKVGATIDSMTLTKLAGARKVKKPHGS